ncbi:golgin subfamily A member 1 isoform X2 [Coregonus clupeaformis]|uniref:golgin subfamily A member 1 isoform X2 n=1 Tax=Coregonus clupeaformis TaxID=59861 RepID=UPI001BE005F0|nr:golgin subfamily A member 1 isoform X2 [Coregonus clupeaformis]
MFAKLKKKIAEEAATAPRTGVRMPRSCSKESITSVGADSGDDFASDGSSSRDDLSSQILRRNDQIRKLEAKLSGYAEQLQLMQKTKDKLEIALEKHQDSSMRKLQDQNETHQTNRAKMAEGMALALDKKDQEKAALSVRLDEMMEQSLTLFQKRDDLDELEGFQQQELAKVKHMLLRKEEQLGQRERELQQKEAELQTAKKGLAEAQEKLRALGEEHQESCRLNTELEIEREELLEVREEAEKKIAELEGRGQNLQKVIQQVSEDFQKSRSAEAAVEKSLHTLQTEHNALKLQQHKAAVTDEDKERVLLDLQEKVSSLERRLQGNLSEDELLQELLKEKSTLERRLEDMRVELLQARTNHADTVSSLETQISRINNNVTELQNLLRHKDDSSKNYRERTDAQIAGLEQQVQESNERLKNTEQQITDKQARLDELQAEWSVERDSLQQQVSAERQQGQERAGWMEEQLSALQTEKDTEHTSAQARISELEEARGALLRGRDEADVALRRRAEELEQARSELSSRQTVSVEIAMALEDTRRQKEELQLQVGQMTTSLQTTSQELAHVTEQLKQREEELQTLRNELQRAQSSLSQLQDEGERLRAWAQKREEEKDSQLVSLRQELLTQTEHLDSCQSRVSELEVEVETLTLQLQTPEVCEPDQNGTVDDLDHMQKANRDLEQQLSDKNKTIKQLQQRLAELKRTLQKELKLKPETELEGKERAQEGRGERQERPDRTFTEPTPAPGPNTTVTNTSDLNDSREINFEYLKHVVLKFMSSREAEAYQLIRAVSVLLNFTGEEEDMLKETLEYKMSWFGSKPSPKGIVRPSVSGAPAHWS